MAEGQPLAAARVFISYRREDSSGHVRALVSPLRARFGRENVVADDAISPGQEFSDVIARELASSKVLLAVIGREWVGALDPRTRQRRLDDPNDPLRIQIAAALRNEHILVIPVLVDRATMPRPEELPEELRRLTLRNAVELQDTRWDSDVEQLVSAIEAIGGNSRKPPSAAPAEPRHADFDRRQKSVAQHLEAARGALKSEDYQTVLSNCERAILLDPECDEAIELAKRARAQILNEQSERARQAERSRAVADALQRARAGFAVGDFAEALRQLNVSLTLAPESVEAQRLRAQIEAARAEAERASAHNRRAQQAVAEARAALAAGNGEAALAALEAFSPPHHVVTHAMEALRAEIEEARRRTHADQELARRKAMKEARREQRAREEYERRENHLKAEEARIPEEEDGERTLTIEPRRAEDQRPVAERWQHDDELLRIERASPTSLSRGGGTLRRIVALPAAALRWLGERLRQPIATRETPDSASTSTGAGAATASPVLLGASAPRQAAPGDNFAARFVAYVEAREDVVVSRLAALAGTTPSTSVVGLSPLKGGRWRTGTPVTVQAAGEHLEVSPARQSFEWNGREQILSFPVSVRPGKSPLTTAICFEVFIEGVPIARVALDILIRDHVTDGRMNRTAARAPETAFASYAAEDRPIVTQCLSALQRHDPGLEIFIDCLDLKPNSEWQQELARVIPTKDVFFLFWSSHAMRSPWVQWELQTVKATRGLGVVCPMPLEDPTKAPPPSELAHLNFGDRYLTARDSALRTGTS